MLGVRPARSSASSPRRASGRAPAAPARRWAGRPRRAAAPSRRGRCSSRRRRSRAPPAAPSRHCRACASTRALSRCILETRPSLVEVRRPVLGDDLQERQRRAPSARRNVSGTRRRMRAKSTSSISIASISRASSRASRAACAGVRAAVGHRARESPRARRRRARPRTTQHQLGERQLPLDLADRRAAISPAPRAQGPIRAREHGSAPRPSR